jgi:L-threonate 2-dehydrogenase
MNQIRNNNVSNKMVVGIIGLGIMGLAIAENLIKDGYIVHGFDTLSRQRQKLKKLGGYPSSSTNALPLEIEVILTSLPSGQALHEVSTALSIQARSGVILVETSTLTLKDKKHAAKLLKLAGIQSLDCPLSGTGSQAKVKDLVVYASGSKPAFNRVKSFLLDFSRQAVYLGKFGNGIKMKFVTNLLVAIHNVATAEALNVAKAAGLNLEQVLDVVSDSAGQSKMWQIRGPRMVKEDYSPMMTMNLWQKDMKIIKAFVDQLSAKTFLFDAACLLYSQTIESGHSQHDCSAVFETIQKIK